MGLLLLKLVQAANDPDRVLWRGRQQIGIARLARKQDLDLGQAEFLPLVLVIVDGGIAWFENLFFAGRHGQWSSYGMVVIPQPVGEKV